MLDLVLTSGSKLHLSSIETNIIRKFLRKIISNISNNALRFWNNSTFCKGDTRFRLTIQSHAGSFRSYFDIVIHDLFTKAWFLSHRVFWSCSFTYLINNLFLLVYHTGGWFEGWKENKFKFKISLLVPF